MTLVTAGESLLELVVTAQTFELKGECVASEFLTTPTVCGR